VPFRVETRLQPNKAPEGSPIPIATIEAAELQQKEPAAVRINGRWFVLAQRYESRVLEESWEKNR
jgi:hypothetical protein